MPESEARPAPKVPQPAHRLGSVDRLRGLVIALMVVDHARYFLSAARFDPTDPAQTTIALFLTRWITHFCAPVFMLLAGAGAALSLRNGHAKPAVSRFLLTRGLWLILLELTVARWGWQFNFDYRYSSGLVFWALGWSMVALAGVIWLPRAAILALAVGMIVLHNLSDGLDPARWELAAPLWTVLHVPGTIHLGTTADFFVLYPLVPWIGVMALGYLLAPRLSDDAGLKSLARLGGAMTAAFVILRWANRYGDPHPWSTQAAAWRTALSVLNTTKYPPSLQFLLMTLGPALFALPFLNRADGPMATLLRDIGRVPLFFWLLHVPLIHLIALLLSLARYGRVVSWLVLNPPAEPPPGYGYGLLTVYLVTGGVILSLYPICRWYGRVKAGQPDSWLRYL